MDATNVAGNNYANGTKPVIVSGLIETSSNRHCMEAVVNNNKWSWPIWVKNSDYKKGKENWVSESIKNLAETRGHGNHDFWSNSVLWRSETLSIFNSALRHLVGTSYVVPTDELLSI